MSSQPPSSASTTATTTARTYYDSSDADIFYHTIWGGSDIHIGLYDSPSDSIATASQRTVSRMASLLEPIDVSTRILDMGAGYGGAARYLAKTYGCKVTCLNLSDVENERNRQMTSEAGLEGLIEVVEGSFEHVPFDENTFDVVWSQDAFLHSGDRAAVVREIARVLVRKNGKVIFTDPMAAEDADPKALAPILQRLHLDSLGSIRFYLEEFEMMGLADGICVACEEHMVTHYSRVLKELEAREGELKEKISSEYLENMKIGLRHWVEGGRNGQIQWGILQFHYGTSYHALVHHSKH